MGIGDWFKRFKSNAAAMEDYREGVAQPQDAGESQAQRAEHEAVHPPRDGSEHRPDPPQT
jgi:hypothetical protein